MKITLPILAALLAIVLFAWWFRYDWHCPSANSCIAYDRITGRWMNPLRAEREEKLHEEILRLRKATGNKFRYEEALLAGYSEYEILEELRKRYKEQNGLAEPPEPAAPAAPAQGFTPLEENKE